MTTRSSISKMAENLLNLYYFYDVSCPNNGSERVIGRPGNPFEELDEFKFKERYRLSKNVVYRLLQEVKCSLYRVNYTALRLSFTNSFISFTKWPSASRSPLPSHQHVTSFTGPRPIGTAHWHGHRSLQARKRLRFNRLRGISSAKVKLDNVNCDHKISRNSPAYRRNYIQTLRQEEAVASC